jgi:hypothetical protein
MVLILGFGLLAQLWYVSDVFAFQCGNRIVSTGDSKADVLIKCGEPTFKETTRVETTGTFGGTSQGPVRSGSTGATVGGSFSRTTTAVDAWTFNCGEGRLIQVLMFQGGKLYEIKSAGYGSGPNKCE